MTPQNMPASLENARWLLSNCSDDGNQPGVLTYCAEMACRWLDSHMVAGNAQNRRIAAAWFRLLGGPICDWSLLPPPHNPVRTANMRLYGAIRAAAAKS